MLLIKGVKDEERHYVTNRANIVKGDVTLYDGQERIRKEWGRGGALTGRWRYPDYLYGLRNLVTLERSSLMKERGNISLDSCAVYLK